MRDTALVAFDIGDVVGWTSHARDWTTRKEGRVVALVPPGVVPFDPRGKLNPVLGLKADRFGLERLGGGGPRRVWSVLVAVDRPRSNPLLYWPYAHRLYVRKRGLR